MAEETVEKMKKAVESLGENISEEEIREAVNKQIEIIDKEFETIFEGYECSDLVFTTTINLSLIHILFGKSSKFTA